ncbi:hypothetical protein ABK040_011477 [Willaertia magna]
MSKTIGIIGAGPGGLTNALLLASKGFKVTLFEKASVVGGRNAPIQVGHSKLDTGPTLLIMKNSLDAVFKDIGRNSEDYLNFIKLNPMYRLVYQQNENNHDMNRNFIDCFDISQQERMESELENTFGKEYINGYRKWLEIERKKYQYIIPLMENIYSSHFDLFNWKAIIALPFIQLHRTMYSTLGKYFEHPLAKISFSFQSKYLGMSPWNGPATYNMIPFAEHVGGIYHVEGGLCKISEQMANIAENELNVNIHLNSPVTKVLTEDRKIKALEVYHEDIKQTKTYYFDEIICNADFPYVVKNLIPNSENLFKTWKPSTFDKKRNSCSGFNLYIALDKIYKDIPAHTIAFAKDIKRNFENVDNGDWSDDVSLYVRNSCVVDKTVSPEGKSGLFAMIFVPNLQTSTTIDWTSDTFKEKVKQLALEILEKKCGFKDIKNHIEEIKMITPIDWHQERNVDQGAIFSMSNTIFQTLSFRPRNKFHELDNLYLSGGHTHPGSGLPVIYLSSRMVTDLICKKYNVPYHRTSLLNV